MARVPSMPNSSGSNGLRWREWSDDPIAARGSPDVEWTNDEHVVAECEVRAQIYSGLQFRQRLDPAATQPEGSTHGPVRSGIAIVGAQALGGRFESVLAFGLALRPMLKSVLPVSERHAGISARERGVQLHRHCEEMPRRGRCRLC